MIQQIIAWVLAHVAVCAALGVAVLDLVFALVPAWESNGVLHWIWLQLKAKQA